MGPDQTSIRSYTLNHSIVTVRSITLRRIAQTEKLGSAASKSKIQNLVKELKADDKYRDMLTWAEPQGTDPVLVDRAITTWIKHSHNNRKKRLAREQKDKNEGNSSSVPPGIKTDGHPPSIQPEPR
jgi:hypothetical protein